MHQQGSTINSAGVFSQRPTAGNVSGKWLTSIVTARGIVFRRRKKGARYLSKREIEKATIKYRWLYSLSLSFYIYNISVFRTKRKRVWRRLASLSRCVNFHCDVNPRIMNSSILATSYRVRCFTLSRTKAVRFPISFPICWNGFYCDENCWNNRSRGKAFHDNNKNYSTVKSVIKWNWVSFWDDDVVIELTRYGSS